MSLMDIQKITRAIARTGGHKIEPLSPEGQLRLTETNVEIPCFCIVTP